MKAFKRIIVVILVVVVAGAIAYFILNRPDTDPGKAPALSGITQDTSLIERGRYLTRAADCEACHTTPGGKPFAGGVVFNLPFGTIYSSNITADKDTGIGRWSDDDFVRAVHQGIRNDGAHLYPAFPYTSYTALSRDDVLAIKAYLFSLPTVHQSPPPNQLKFPFNQRWAVGFWNALFFDSHRFKNDPSRSAAWNRGHYLATALGHCGECHTPRNGAFAMKDSQALSGATLQGWRAYNITPDTTAGIGHWSAQALASYLHTGHAAGHGSAAGPMGEAVAYSLQYLSQDDIDALVSYLRSVPAHRGSDPIEIAPHPPALRAASADAPGNTTPTAPHGHGQQLFAGACASCHQWDGQGRETPYAALLGAASVNDPSAQNAVQILLHGATFRMAGQDVHMPAFGQGYSDADIAAMANFVVHHFGDKQGQVTPDQVRQARHP